MADKKNYIYWDGDDEVITNEFVRQKLKREKWREEKRDARFQEIIVSLDEICEFGNELRVVKSQKSVDDIVIDNLIRENLHKAISLLSQDEQIIINETYYNLKTEREIAITLSKSKTAIHSRKEQALKKLFNFLKNI